MYPSSFSGGCRCRRGIRGCACPILLLWREPSSHKRCLCLCDRGRLLLYSVNLGNPGGVERRLDLLLSFADGGGIVQPALGTVGVDSLPASKIQQELFICAFRPTWGSRTASSPFANL